MINFTAPLSPQEKKRRTLTDDLARARRDLNGARDRASGDVNFAQIFKRKSNRNNLGQPFKGIGKQKILAMIGAGISTAREMIAFNDYTGHPDVLPQWRDVFVEYFDKLQENVMVLEAKVESIQSELEVFQIAEAMFRIEEEVDLEDNSDMNVTTEATEEEKPPVFSGILDPCGWNLRCVSKSTIDRVMATNAAHRKEVQMAKMQNIPASVLKIDWSYKLAPKIKVYTGRGQSFAPFKSSVNVHNENAMCMFWKCYPTAESYGPKGMGPDLKRMKERLDHLGCKVKLVYVDNCCSVRNMLTGPEGIFPEALIKLDGWHWMERWKPALNDAKSTEAMVFWHLIRASAVLHRRWRNRTCSEKASEEVPAG
ncbi:unknown protein [Seminavis robusta]|uniref:Uncharacterized protein n=1 Tax=Seminavis robusta TaxID=568900 RepID=A0A9N8HY70_9STRA|nr:unknown protein [Seminavis robusta]|eukprot:Sro3693_g350390.1 n/a (368) ;mRNA; f:1294-2397